MAPPERRKHLRTASANLRLGFSLSSFSLCSQKRMCKPTYFRSPVLPPPPRRDDNHSWMVPATYSIQISRSRRHITPSAEGLKKSFHSVSRKNLKVLSFSFSRPGSRTKLTAFTGRQHTTCCLYVNHCATQ